MKMHHNKLGIMRPEGRSQTFGFTIIELMIVVALIGVLLALAAPSMREMIDVRRLRAINAQLFTDLQYARSEAIARRAVVRLDFRTSATYTCYTMSTSREFTVDFRCNCLLGPAPACPAGTDVVEIRTVSLPKTLRTEIVFPSGQERFGFGFEPTMGALVTTPLDMRPNLLREAKVETAIDNTRKFRIELIQSGRPTICAPTGSRMDVQACPP